MFRRLLVALILVATAVVLLIAAWPQLLNLQGAPLIAQVVSLRGVAALGALVIGVVVFALALFVRPLRVLCSGIAALALVFVVVSGAILLSRGIENGGPESGGDGSTGGESLEDESPDDGPAVVAGEGGLTVLSWNTLGDAPGAAEIARLVIETGADIVALPETTEETAIAVAELTREAGRPMYVNWLSLDDELKARTTSLLTSAELGTYSRDDSLGTTSVVPTVIATPDDGDGPVIIAAHPVAPIPGYLDAWREDLDWLSTVCRGPDVIMAGDLNSTLDHYGSLATTPGAAIGDCVDSAERTGAAAIGTWPTSVPTLLGAPIDHVMATPNWRFTSTRVIEDRDGLGSDHRPIVARLVPAD